MLGDKMYLKKKNFTGERHSISQEGFLFLVYFSFDLTTLLLKWSYKPARPRVPLSLFLLQVY